MLVAWLSFGIFLGPNVCCCSLGAIMTMGTTRFDSADCLSCCCKAKSPKEDAKSCRAAQANLGEAVGGIRRVENALQERLATAFREYNGATLRTDRYRTAVLPRAQETYDLSSKAYRGGLFEYLRVLQAQRTVAEARLELVRALTDAWKSASAISAIMLEEGWPRGSSGPAPTHP
jgi:hypothetical protein